MPWIAATTGFGDGDVVSRLVLDDTSVPGVPGGIYHVGTCFWHDGLRFDVFAVRHHAANTAFGLALRGSFVYTGDTRPIPEVLEHYGTGAVLIAHDCGLVGNPSHTGLDDLAAAMGVPVDMHCDESDDPLSRHVETLAFHTQRLGLQGRVTGSHLTSMHSMDNYYVSKLIPLVREAGVAAIANPLINITLQGRHDTYPKRRGLTRVAELRAAGVTVAFGHDCVMDPWYSLGSGDMLEVAHMAVHVGQLTSLDAMAACFRSVTVEPARILGLEGYGIEPGCRADLVVLEAGDAVEAIRLKAARLFVLRAGRVVAQASPRVSRLDLPGRPPAVGFLHGANAG